MVESTAHERLRPANIPRALESFEHAGISFTRVTETHQPGIYQAVAPDGRKYTVMTEGGSKRKPVRVVDSLGAEHRSKTLLMAAEWIASLASRRA